MTSLSYIDLEISLLETSGPFLKIGKPNLFCWFKAIHLPGTPFNEARVSVIVPADSKNSWKELSQELTMEQSQAVCGLLKRLDIPAKQLDVYGVVDTSDGWSNISLRIQVGGKSFAIDIAMQSSGFKGEDAEGLRALFRQLFEFAEYKDYDLYLYGSA